MIFVGWPFLGSFLIPAVNICNTTAFLVTYDHHQVASWATFCCSSFFLSSKDSHLGKEFCLEIYVDYHTLISYKCLHEIYFINKREWYWSSIASFVNFLQYAFQSFPRNHIHVDDLKPNMRKNLFFFKNKQNKYEWPSLERSEAITFHLKSKKSLKSVQI